MKVQDVMSAPVVTLRPDDRVPIADAIMQETFVRHMPVVDPESGALLGIVSRHDLLRRALEVVLDSASCPEVWRVEGVPVNKVMTVSVVVAAGDDPLEDAARSMLEHKLGCLPVVSGGELVGILTEADFVRLAADGSHSRVEGEKDVNEP